MPSIILIRIAYVVQKLSTLYYANYSYLFYVLGLTKGKRDDKLGIRAASSCNIILDNVIVPTENMLGNEGDGFKIALSGIGKSKTQLGFIVENISITLCFIDLARIGIASQALGISQAAMDCAIDYAGKRIAFDNTIIKLSAVQV